MVSGFLQIVLKTVTEKPWLWAWDVLANRQP